MLFHNGKQEIFAKANKEGHPECQYSEFEFPFQEYALHPEKQQGMISNRNPGYITQEVIPPDITDTSTAWLSNPAFPVFLFFLFFLPL